MQDLTQNPDAAHENELWEGAVQAPGAADGASSTHPGGPAHAPARLLSTQRILANTPKAGVYFKHFRYSHSLSFSLMFSFILAFILSHENWPNL